MRRNPFRRPGLAPQARIQAAAAGAREATVYVYDYIGGWDGISARDLVPQLQALDVDTIHLRINSPGGDVFEGVTLFNAFRQHRAKVVTHIDGLAASIASVIALAGDEVRIGPGAFFMIHDPWVVAIGTAAELRQTADTVDKVSEASVIATYVQASGVEREQIVSWMAEETWFSADEAVEHGFADAIDEAIEAEASVDGFDLSGFRRTPAALLERRTAAGSAPTVRNLERHLRDAGLSRSEAKRIAALASTHAPSLRDAAEDGLVSSAAQLAATIRSL